MLIDNLKQEYELRYNIIRYKKLYRDYVYNRFEKNNYNIIMKSIEDINVKNCERI